MVSLVLSESHFPSKVALASLIVCRVVVFVCLLV